MAGVNFIGDIHAAGGLGTSTRGNLQAILQQQIPVSLVDIGYDQNKVTVPPAMQDLPQGLQYPISLLHGNVHVGTFYRGNWLKEHTDSTYTAAFWYWELSQLPERYLPHLAMINEVWVASRFVQQTVLQAGLKPVTYIPLPISVPLPDHPSRATFDIPDNRYTFLFNFSMQTGHGRKNPWAVIEAFRRAFGTSSTDDGPLLIMKTFAADNYPAVRDKLYAELESVGGLLIDELLPMKQHYELSAVTDAYVSLHRSEGFGLGMAEAMYLGKPVIATNYSSNTDFTLPENSYPVDYTLRPIQESDHHDQPPQAKTYPPGSDVWADADIDQAAAYMRHLYENPDAGRQKGTIAARFIRENYSLETCGQAIAQRLNEIQRLYDLEKVKADNHAFYTKYPKGLSPQAATETERQPRIALWTPLPPQKTGIADYVAEMLPDLSRYARIEIFIDENYTADPALSEYAIYPGTMYETRHAVQPFDLDIYQMGNSVFHLYLYEQMLKKPGLVVLHDLSISSILYSYLLRQHQTTDAFAEELIYSEGEAAYTDIADDIKKRNTDALLSEFGSRYMARRLTEASHAVLTHLEFAESEFQRRYEATSVYTGYLGSPDLLEMLDTTDSAVLRARHDIAPDSFVIGVFGSVFKTKQPEVIVKAVSRLLKRHKNVQLLFVGELKTWKDYDKTFRRLITQHTMTDHTTITGYATYETFLEYMVLCDVVVNLRSPSYGQMSATLTRSIAAGKPSIITDLPEWRFLPESFCWRVPEDDRQGNQLEHYLEQLMATPGQIEERGRNARMYFLHQGRIAYSAMELASLARDVIQSVPAEERQRLPDASSVQDTANTIDLTSAEQQLHRLYKMRETWRRQVKRTTHNRITRVFQRVPIVGRVINRGVSVIMRVLFLGRLLISLDNVLGTSFNHLVAQKTLNQQLAQQLEATRNQLEATRNQLEATRNQLNITSQKYQSDIETLNARLSEQQTFAQQINAASEKRHQEQVRQQAYLREMLLDEQDLPAFFEYENPIADQVADAQSDMARYPETSEQDRFERYYILFEEVFRGDESLIRERQTAYLDYLPLDKTRQPVVDAGCGRGEFLDLLRSRDVSAIGVETNETLVEYLRTQGHTAHHADALSFLNEQSANSLGGITAFQVIEHLTFDYLQMMLYESYRTIDESGFILLETINPLCYEALSSFHTDVTHENPLQPFQMAFLLQYTGFHTIRIFLSSPVQAHGKLEAQNKLRMYQDYAVLGYK